MSGVSLWEVSVTGVLTASVTGEVLVKLSFCEFIGPGEVQVGKRLIFPSKDLTLVQLWEQSVETIQQRIFTYCLHDWDSN